MSRQQRLQPRPLRITEVMPLQTVLLTGQAKKWRTTIALTAWGRLWSGPRPCGKNAVPEVGVDVRHIGGQQRIEVY
jgi:hypothetical protein